jgi:hypothetical protein
MIDVVVVVDPFYYFLNCNYLKRKKRYEIQPLNSRSTIEYYSKLSVDIVGN